MKVELLYFASCPNYEALLPRLKELVEETDPGGDVELRAVETIEAAELHRFLGSPTVRVDGEDVDPGAATRSDFGLECRLYRTESGYSPVPPEEWIRKALSRRAGA